MNIGDNVKILDVHTRPNGKQGTDKFKRKSGVIKEIKEENYLGVKTNKYLIEGEGITGAGKPIINEVETTDGKFINVQTVERIENSRWVYDFMVEKVN